MQNSGVHIFLLLSLFALVPATLVESSAAHATPLPPDTGGMQAKAADAAVAAPPAPDYPVSLSIPSLSLGSPIIRVGVNAKGEMDVPSGKTNSVGWYEYGTVPGDTGSAVIDAHVFAAFSRLKNAQVGSDIYVETQAGKTLHFVVQDIELYKLADVPDDVLFNRSDAARLNLITCAGKLTPDHSTYDHRLVVYAVLAS